MLNYCLSLIHQDTNLKESIVLFANWFQNMVISPIPFLFHCAVVFTQDLQFKKNYSSPPIIMIAVRHNSSGDNLLSKYISITAWIEVLSHTFRSIPQLLYRIGVLDRKYLPQHECQDTPREATFRINSTILYLIGYSPLRLFRASLTNNSNSLITW